MLVHGGKQQILRCHENGAATIEIVILSVAKDLAFVLAHTTKQQVLRYAQDDKVVWSSLQRIAQDTTLDLGQVSPTLAGNFVE